MRVKLCNSWSVGKSVSEKEGVCLILKHLGQLGVEACLSDKKFSCPICLRLVKFYLCDFGWTTIAGLLIFWLWKAFRGNFLQNIVSISDSRWPAFVIYTVSQLSVENISEQWKILNICIYLRADSSKTVIFSIAFFFRDVCFFKAILLKMAGFPVGSFRAESCCHFVSCQATCSEWDW